MEYEIMQSNEALTVFSVLMSTFMIGWIAFGIKWIRKAANSFSNHEVVE